MNGLIQFILTAIAAIISLAQAPVATPVAPPAAPVVRQAWSLSTVPGLQLIVSEDGRLPDGTCPRGCVPSNYFDSTARIIIIAANQSARTVQHETCHAHQDEVVLEELSREPRVDLIEWYQTTEGRLYGAAFAGLPRDTFGTWYSEYNALEDFANSCAYYVLGMPLDPARFALMVQLLGEK